MNRNASLLTGIGLGAGLMYVLDSERGRRRRSVVRHKVTSAAHGVPKALASTRRDLGNRARGLAAEIRSLVSTKEAPDWIVVERVRSALGGAVSHPGAIHVTADGGCVTLHGPVLADELDRALRTAGAVAGVTSVRNQLDPHHEPGRISALQGGRPRTGARWELLQDRWSPATRLVTGVLGAALAVYGTARRGVLGSGLGLAGAGLLARGATNLDLGRLLGVAAGRRVIDVQKAIAIDAPVETVYEFWRNYENFPAFMTHVRSVKEGANGVSHWVVDGPAGVPVEWDAVLTRQVPNELLAWTSVDGAAVAHAGSVRFTPRDDGRTEVQIRLSYNPPAGAIGHSLAWLAGIDPKRQIDDDMVRMKTLIETGVPPRDAARRSADSSGAAPV